MLSIPLRIIGQACGLHLQQVNASAITGTTILEAWQKTKKTHILCRNKNREWGKQVEKVDGQQCVCV